MTAPESANTAGDQPRSFIEHLEELRGVIIKSALYVAAGMALCIPFAPRIFMLLKEPLRGAGQDPDTFLTVFSVAGGFGLATQVVFWSGLLVSMPFVLRAVAGFVAPALTAGEKSLARRGAAAGILLFCGGAALAYLMMPFVLRMMLSVNVWMGTPSTMWTADSYAAFVLRMMLVFGLAFELPVVLFILTAIGVIEINTLRVYRRHVIVAISAFSMLVTPQDPLSMILLAVPLVLLYEGCIMASAAYQKRRS